MRSTTIFALAAATGLSYATIDSLETLNRLVNSDSASDTQISGSASGSFETSGTIGLQFTGEGEPAAVADIAERDDKQISGSVSGSFETSGTIGLQSTGEGESATVADIETSGTIGLQFTGEGESATVADIAERDDTSSLFGQCGGNNYNGPTSCPSGQQCYRRDATYSQCLPTVQQAYGQCGGANYFGTTACAAGTTCKRLRSDYSQCIPDGSKISAKTVEQDEADMDPKHTAEGEDVDPVHASMASAYASETTVAAQTSTAVAYTSEASLMTEDTMMAVPTTSSTHNATMTAGMPKVTETEAATTEPVQYDGAASGLMVPSFLIGGMAVLGLFA